MEQFRTMHRAEAEKREDEWKGSREYTNTRTSTHMHIHTNHHSEPHTHTHMHSTGLVAAHSDYWMSVIRVATTPFIHTPHTHTLSYHTHTYSLPRCAHLTLRLSTATSTKKTVALAGLAMLTAAGAVLRLILYV